MQAELNINLNVGTSDTTHIMPSTKGRYYRYIQALRTLLTEQIESERIYNRFCLLGVVSAHITVPIGSNSYYLRYAPPSTSSWKQEDIATSAQMHSWLRVQTCLALGLCPERYNFDINKTPIPLKDRAFVQPTWKTADRGQRLEERCVELATITW